MNIFHPLKVFLCHSSNDELVGSVHLTFHEDHIYFDPIPNFIFTRDIAVVIKDHVIITKAAKSARFRENLLTRFIFYANPLFKALNEQGKIINLNHLDKFPPSKKGVTPCPQTQCIGLCSAPAVPPTSSTSRK